MFLENFKKILGRIESESSPLFFNKKGSSSLQNLFDEDYCGFTGCQGQGNTDHRFEKHRNRGHCPKYFDFMSKVVLF